MYKTTKADIKIIIIGNCDTGKTSFCQLWVKQEFSEKYKATIMTDFNFKIYEYKGNLYKIQIWDIAGQDRSIQTTKVLTNLMFNCKIMSKFSEKQQIIFWDFILGKIRGKFIYDMFSVDELSFPYALLAGVVIYILLAFFGLMFMYFNSLVHPKKEEGTKTSK